MNKLKLISILISIAIIVISCLLFIPRTYDVEIFRIRKGTQFWNLKTGSKIGYFKLETNQELIRTPILYLHGGPGGKITDQIIGTLRPFVSEGHDVYFYDQIGSGHSDRLAEIEDYTVDRHRRDLQEIIAKISSDKIILIGHSWGAVLAINYLTYEPDRVEKLVLSGPGPILPINTEVINAIPPEHLPLTQPEFTNRQGNRNANNWRSKFMSKWAHIFKTKLASDQEADDFFTHLNQELSKSTDCVLNENRVVEGGGGYYSHIKTLSSIQDVENKRDKLGTIKTPILILRGQCDNQKWGFTKEYLDLFINSTLEIIEDAGHNIINSAEKEYVELIKKFLKD